MKIASGNSTLFGGFLWSIFRSLVFTSVFLLIQIILPLYFTHVWLRLDLVKLFWKILSLITFLTALKVSGHLKKLTKFSIKIGPKRTSTGSLILLAIPKFEWIQKKTSNPLKWLSLGLTTPQKDRVYELPPTKKGRVPNTGEFRGGKFWTLPFFWNLAHRKFGVGKKDQTLCIRQL